MTIIKVNHEQAEQLRTATGTVELVDENGNILCRFLSGSSGVPYRRSPLSMEELAKRRLQKGGKPLSEILDRLRELP